MAVSFHKHELTGCENNEGTAQHDLLTFSELSGNASPLRSVMLKLFSADT